jgi:hypothetical protein
MGKTYEHFTAYQAIKPLITKKQLAGIQSLTSFWIVTEMNSRHIPHPSCFP